jgi:hypothetical protein
MPLEKKMGSSMRAERFHASRPHRRYKDANIIPMP